MSGSTYLTGMFYSLINQIMDKDDYSQFFFVAKCPAPPCDNKQPVIPIQILPE